MTISHRVRLASFFSSAFITTWRPFAPPFFLCHAFACVFLFFSLQCSQFPSCREFWILQCQTSPLAWSGTDVDLVGGFTFLRPSFSRESAWEVSSRFSLMRSVAPVILLELSVVPVLTVLGWSLFLSQGLLADVTFIYRLCSSDGLRSAQFRILFLCFQHWSGTFVSGPALPYPIRFLFLPRK